MVKRSPVVCVTAWFFFLTIFPPPAGIQHLTPPCLLSAHLSWAVVSGLEMHLHLHWCLLWSPLAQLHLLQKNTRATQLVKKTPKVPNLKGQDQGAAVMRKAPPGGQSCCHKSYMLLGGWYKWELLFPPLKHCFRVLKNTNFANDVIFVHTDASTLNRPRPSVDWKWPVLDWKPVQGVYSCVPPRACWERIRQRQAITMQDMRTSCENLTTV